MTGASGYWSYYRDSHPGFVTPSLSAMTGRRCSTSLLVLVLLVVARAALGAQTMAGAFVPLLARGTAPTTVPTLVVGERLTYEVRFGALRVGSGSMEVRETADVRGRPAWHTVFAVKGGIPFFHVDDRLESWIDTSTFASVRFEQHTSEGHYHKEHRVELFPERGIFVEEGSDAGEEPTGARPLDEGAFLYFLRGLPLAVGDSYDFDRYYRPAGNPVALRVLRRERIEVPAGTFETVVLQPTIKTTGIFSQNGHAEVWVTDDARHMIVQMKAHLSFGSLNLYLRRYEPGVAAPTPSVAAQ